MMIQHDSILPGAHAELDSERDAPTSLRIVGFWVGDLACAFRIDVIQEVIVPAHITTMPQVPAYVEGIYSLRGTMIPIINLHTLFGLAAPSSKREMRTMVVRVEARTIGCQVDAVAQVMPIPLDHIQPAASPMTANGRRYISGFVHDDGQVWVLLDADELLHPDKLDDIYRHRHRQAMAETSEDRAL